jgi:hypothetical protein
MLNAFFFFVRLSGDLGDEDLAFVGDRAARDEDGGFRTAFVLELLKGRRLGFETVGMGAWLVMGGKPRSKISS